MAKRIIILDRIPLGGGRLAFNYVLWAEVPLARQPFYAHPNAKSVWTGAIPPGHYKWQLVNRTGVANAASGNTASVRTYGETVA